MSIIRDTLYCCSIVNTHNIYKQRYGKGVLVGIVCVLMTRYKKDAFKKAIEYLYKVYSIDPFTINSKCIPESWLSDFREVFKTAIS